MGAKETAATLVFLAGIGNSEEDHWQRHWYRRAPRGVWVEQDDWDAPECRAWVANLDRALREVSGPKILVAHSLGCLLVPEWAAEYEAPEVVGAFLVAVPDAAGPAFPEAVAGFGSTSRTRLPFPSMIVASRDDPYGSLDHARRLADIWGSRFVDVGTRGHINLESDLGAWNEGRRLFEMHFGAADLVEGIKEADA